MIATMLQSPAFSVLAAIGLFHVIWWLLGDFLLEHVGIPFLDGGSARECERREPADRAHHASSSRRATHARHPSERRQPTSRPAIYERDRRSTGMSRGVRA
jgi:hypothetical protein